MKLLRSFGIVLCLALGFGAISCTKEKEREPEKPITEDSIIAEVKSLSFDGSGATKQQERSEECNQSFHDISLL